jgi:hypothetical protein
MQELILQIVGTWVRAGLTLSSGILIAHHVMTAPQGEQLSTMLFAQIVNALPGLGAQGWSMLQKYWAEQKFHTALTMPQGTAPEAVKAKIANGLAAPISVLFLASALGLGLTLSACGASARHIAVVADQTIYEAVADIHSGEQAALCGLPSCATSTKVEVLPGWTLAKSQAFNKKLLVGEDAARELNSIVSGWTPGASVPTTVTTLIGHLADSLTNVLADFPNGSTKTKMLADIRIAQSIVLNAFNIILIVKGA